ncbi:MAG: outer membrane beta-barrel protein [Fibrobacter sp.]|nr:outer membrane beta-barrel protein [Fibrobacter sp.]
MNRIFLLLFVFTSLVFAQENVKVGARLGTGFNIYFWRSYLSSHTNDALGMSYDAGLAFGFPILKGFSFTPELNFTYRNIQSSNSYGYDDRELKYYAEIEESRTEYLLGVPLLFEFRPNISGFFYMAIGAQLEFLFVSKLTLKNLDDDISTSIGRKHTDRNFFDLGFIPFAFGYVIKERARIDHKIVVTRTGENSRDYSARFDFGITYYFKH